MCVLLTKDCYQRHYMGTLNKIFDVTWKVQSKKIWQLNFLSKKLIHMKENVCLRFELLKNFWSAEKQPADALTATKQKRRVDNSCVFQSLKSSKVVRTITVLRLPLLTKKV